MTQHGFVERSEFNYQSEPARKFIEASFRDGAFRETGTDVAQILPSMSRFSRNRATKKETVLADSSAGSVLYDLK